MHDHRSRTARRASIARASVSRHRERRALSFAAPVTLCSQERTPQSGGHEEMAIKRFKTGTRLSQAVVHGDTVYLAGVVADDYSLDSKGQTTQILAKID